MKKAFLLIITFGLIFIYWCEGQGGGLEEPGIQETIQEIQQQSDEVVQIYYFWWDGCPACAQQNEFFEQLKEDYEDQISINRFEVWWSTEKSRLFGYVWEQLGYRTNSVPFTIIEEEWYVWVVTNELEDKINNCLNTWCEDPVIDIIKDFE